MKSKRILLILLAVIFNLAFFTNVSAESEFNVVNGGNDIKVDIDGSFVVFNEETDYPFQDEEGRVFIPFKAVMEEFGCNVVWDKERSVAVAVKDAVIVEVPPNQNYIRQNGFKIVMDSNTVLKENKLYVPIRVIFETFGAEVNWNQAAKTVIVKSLNADMKLMTVHFIDVEHGDSILIDYDEYEVLIDAGISNNSELISDYIKPYVDGSLDLLIATHSHKDHVGGLPKIFEDYEVSRVIDSGSSLDTPEWYAYAQALLKEDCIISYDEDETIDISEGVQLRIIEALDGQSKENNNSVSALIKFNNVSILFTGDNQVEAEEIISQKVGKVDVFKASHHGSYNANSEALLEVIRPEYIVISAGKGVNYTHPHASALKRMFDIGSTVYGTFKSGTIILKTNGVSYSFETIPSEDRYLAKPLVPLQLIDAGTYQKNVDHFIK